METDTTFLIQQWRPDSAGTYWVGGDKGLIWGPAEHAVEFLHEAHAFSVMRLVLRQPEYLSMDLRVVSKPE